MEIINNNVLMTGVYSYLNELIPNAFFSHFILFLSYGPSPLKSYTQSYYIVSHNLRNNYKQLQKRM